MPEVNVSDWINQVTDSKTRRALQAVAEMLIGDSGDVKNLGSGESHISVHTQSQSVSASASVRPIWMVNRMAGAAGVGGRAEFHMVTNVALGSWANALKGYIEFEASGRVTGLGSAIVAEMLLPGATLAGGSYGVLEIELVTQASGLTGGCPVAMQWMQVSGNQTAIDDWEDNGYIWIIKGLSDAAGNIFDTNTTPTCDATLRILVGTTPYYILLSSSPTS